LTRTGAGCRRQAAEVGLSAVLAQLPSLFDERKITAVERGVSAVDALPPRYRNVKVAHQLALHTRSIKMTPHLAVGRRARARAIVAAGGALLTVRATGVSESKGAPSWDARRQLSTAPGRAARPHTGAPDAQALCLSKNPLASLFRRAGALPEQKPRWRACLGAQALYLSKNPLASLAGVAQFGALRCLGAGDCGLAGLEALAPLAPLAATLQTAAFEGCPLAALPHYRAHARPLSPRAQLLQTQRARREAWRRAQLSGRLCSARLQLPGMQVHAQHCAGVPRRPAMPG